MPPNSITPAMGPEPHDFVDGPKPAEKGPPRSQSYEENYKLMIFQSSVNLLGHLLIGMIVATCYFFAFSGGLPLTKTRLHVVLCVTGYQLLMGQAILSLSNQNGWSTRFRLIDKRRAHWILQLLGSGLAIAGTFIKILDKDTHWTTLHGQFALVALVFTSVSLVNGLASLWSYELRRFLPANLSKLTHICFGTIAFAAASITLCYGMDKGSFRNWATTPLADTAISFVAILIFIVIFNPLFTFYSKVKGVSKRK